MSILSLRTASIRRFRSGFAEVGVLPPALSAAKLGRELKLPLADSVILATARRCEATLWTQDADFEGLEGVRYSAKGRSVNEGRDRSTKVASKRK